MANKRRNNGLNCAPESLTREHCSSSGSFTWTLKFPERTSASLGAIKPRAQVLCEGYEPYHIATAIAKTLEKQLKTGERQEPESHAELLFCIREISEKLALQRVVDMVSRREYSSQEALSRLTRDGYPKTATAKAVERAQELGILNDKRFTESYIRSKVYQGWGPIRIERELSVRGIEAATVEGWPEAYFGQEGIAQAASELLATKRIPDKNAYEKLIRFLVTRGYSLAVAKSAVRTRLESERAQSDEL